VRLDRESRSDGEWQAPAAIGGVIGTRFHDGTRPRTARQGSMAPMGCRSLEPRKIAPTVLLSTISAGMLFWSFSWSEVLAED
jgi:hypothetical protein